MRSRQCMFLAGRSLPFDPHEMYLVEYAGLTVLDLVLFCLEPLVSVLCRLMHDLVLREVDCH